MKYICMNLSVMLLFFLACTTNLAFTGKIELDMQNERCTRMRCGKPPCCNQCQANIIAISKNKTVELYGNIIDTALNGSTPQGSNKMRIETTFVKMKSMPLVCKFKECADPICSLYELGKTYKLTGKYIRTEGATRYNAFFVKASQKID